MKFLRTIGKKLTINSFSTKNPWETFPKENGGFFSIPHRQTSEYNISKIFDGRVLKDSGIGLIPVVQEFKRTINNDPILRMWFFGAFDSLPEGSYLNNSDPDQLFHAISSICTSAPKFKDSNITGVPLYSLFVDLANTQYGQIFFSHHTVNEKLKKILNAYNNLLQSKISLEHMNQSQPYGWLCPTAQKYVNWRDYQIDKSKPHWGFQSWNDWFTRKLRPEARPVDPDPYTIVHSSDAYPISYPEGSTGTNPAYNVKIQNKFWLKDQQYSLYDMLNARERPDVKEICDKHFAGGTIFQSFLDPWCYHRWHSPVSGLIQKSYKINGTYYFSSPGFHLPTQKNQPHKYINSLPVLSMVSTRHIYIIKLLDGSNRRVAVLEIGMVEVSSCNSTVIEGQYIKKGQELGHFQFGGSSYAIIFDKDFDLTFNPEIYKCDTQGRIKKQLVNSWLARF